MSEQIYKCADCGSYEIIEGSEEDCEETYKDDQKPLVSPYYACGEPKNHNYELISDFLQELGSINAFITIIKEKLEEKL